MCEKDMRSRDMHLSNICLLTSLSVFVIVTINEYILKADKFVISIFINYRLVQLTEPKPKKQRDPSKNNG